MVDDHGRHSALLNPVYARQRERHHEQQVNGCTLGLQHWLVQHIYKNCGIKGWEGDLAVTSVTSLITRIDSADLAG